MESQSINLEDYTCSICREIFRIPVSLSCPHTYCLSCVNGLKKPSTDSSGQSSFFRTDSSSHSNRHHQAQQCFLCAICRQESFGYVRYRELENRMNQLVVSCSNCDINLKISELRQHSDTCQMNQNQSRSETNQPVNNQRLSESQIQALQKAQQGQNRSTFQCPFCPRANFTLIHLRQHIKKRHREEDQHRICPICASMPWGDKTTVSSNIYQHIKTRHRFDYETYVNFEQDEETMIREALQASLIDQ